MGSNSTFISITTPPSSDGSLSFSLDTFDAETNVSLNLTISGILSSYDEEETATLIYTSLSSQLSSYAYSGEAVFSDSPFVATFRVHKTQHVVSIWSQCGYELQLQTNTCGAVAKVSTAPVLMTVSKARSFANIKGFQLVSGTGVSLTDSEVTELLLRSSVQICSYLRCKVAITTYLNSFRGQDNKSVFTTPTPGINRDVVRVRRKAYINLYTNPTYMTFTFFWNRMTGELNYRPTSNVVNTKAPWDLDNEAHLTFTAGWYVIPEDILWVITDLNEMSLLGINNLKELKGGSGDIVFQDASSIYARIFAPIKRLRSRGGKNNNA